MNFYQLTPGAGAMYCGNCIRDNALVAALRELGHHALMIPLYLPLTLDEADQSAGTPLFFNGINVYLEQQSALFRRAPGWLHRLLAAPRLLKWAAGKAVSTRPSELGELTLSMLRGEEGRQARELDSLIAWLKTQPPPDAICLSNALLIGLVRRLRAELKAPILCGLQGEDTFLAALPDPHRTACWKTMSDRAADADLFIAPSRFFADLMRARLGLPEAKVRVVPNGIRRERESPKSGLSPGEAKAEFRSQGSDPTGPEEARLPGSSASPAVLGFFARMCPEKGLDLAVEAFIRLRQRGRAGRMRFHAGGYCGPSDQAFVESQRARLRSAGLMEDAEFHPNPDHAAKRAFLRSLSVFSAPARYGEAFGLYVLEALAAGVPVVQPRAGAFPEIVEATGGGLLCEPNDPQSLAETIETLLLAPDRARQMGEAGRIAVAERYSAEAMARAVAGEAARLVCLI